MAIQKMARHKLPAVWMRAGTSKGLFVLKNNLPADQSQWAGPLLAAMGSDARQLNGVGGATSTTSKVAVVSKSDMEGIDVDYTFAQVSFGSGTVDFSGNCGNMASGVGPFAIQEGLIQPPQIGETKVDVTIFNTNTQTKIIETVEIDEAGDFREDGNFAMPGLDGITGSEIKVAFMNPAGSMTDDMFPSGSPWDFLTINATEAENGPFCVRVTLLDVANPFVIVDATTLPSAFQDSKRDDAIYLSLVESIRCKGAVSMGLADSITSASHVRGTPKIAFVWPSFDGKADISVRSFSMGKPHPSLQLTGAICLGAAVCIPGTVASYLSTISAQVGGGKGLPSPARTPSPVPLMEEWSESREIAAKAHGLTGGCGVLRTTRIEHPSGLIEVEIVTRLILGKQETRVEVDRGVVSRTARRLFEGNVYFYI